MCIFQVWLEELPPLTTKISGCTQGRPQQILVRRGPLGTTGRSLHLDCRVLIDAIRSFLESFFDLLQLCNGSPRIHENPGSFLGPGVPMVVQKWWICPKLWYHGHSCLTKKKLWFFGGIYLPSVSKLGIPRMPIIAATTFT